MLSKEFLYECDHNNKNGKMSVEKFVKKHYYDDYTKILDFTKHLELSFKERVYFTMNRMTDYVICGHPDCGNRVSFKNSTIGYYEHCSINCISSNPKIRKKVEETCFRKFGTKTPCENDEIKIKTLKTINERYGGNSAMCSKEVQEKSKKTLMGNYGVEHTSYHPELLKRRIETFKENSESYRENYVKTCIDKYGVDHPMKVDAIMLPAIKKLNKVRRNNITIKIVSKLPPNYDFIKTYMRNDIRYIKILCPKCEEEFKVTRGTLFDRCDISIEICTNCNPTTTNSSGMEKMLLAYIKEIYNGKIIENSRKIISPYELDIYLPGLKLGIEFNGLYWHSDVNIDKGKHYDKYLVAKKIGIDLLVIWENDWCEKVDIVKKMLRNRICPDSKNYLDINYCEVRNINRDIAINHIEENTLKEYKPSSILLGLYYKEDLISTICLSKRKGEYYLNTYSFSYEYDFKQQMSILFNHLGKDFQYSSQDNITNDLLVEKFDCEFIKHKISKRNKTIGQYNFNIWDYGTNTYKFNNLLKS